MSSKLTSSQLCFSQALSLRAIFMFTSVIFNFIEMPLSLCNLSFSIDPRYKLFHVMATSLVGMGALTGGFIGMLLPKISTGIVLGCLVATLICTALVVLEMNLSFSYNIPIFVAFIVLSLVTSQRFYVSFSSFNTCFFDFNYFVFRKRLRT